MRFLILCLSLLLAGCGYHLRGEYTVPPGFQNVYVDYGQPYDPFVRKIKDALTHANVNVVKEASQAKYILRILSISQNANLQATSTTGQVNTYMMQYAVSFEVGDAEGKILLPPQTAQSSENYTLSSTQLLANFNQQPNLIAFLQQDVAMQILLRLSGDHAKKVFQ
jgi:LPS-assembly lipoprotein